MIPTFFLNGMGGIFEVLLFLFLAVGVFGMTAFVLSVVHLAQSTKRASNGLRYASLTFSILSAVTGMAFLGSHELNGIGIVLLIPIVLSIIAFTRDQKLPTNV